MLTTLDEKVHPDNAALVIVDVQNDYCHPDGATARNGQSTAMAQAMVPALQRLLAEARRVGVPVIFVRMAQTQATFSEVQREQRQRRGSRVPVCTEGTWGAEFYEVAPAPGDLVVTKHRYSAFIGTDLDLILRSKGIKALIFAGVATNVCVESSARDAFMLDYYVVFMKDCSGCSAGPDAHAATLANIERSYGVVTSSEEVFACWNALAVRA
jgi:ureidoacrylate peracid hydrolase